MRLLLIILCFPLIVCSNEGYLKEKIISDISDKIISICHENRIGFIEGKTDSSEINDFWSELFSELNANISGPDTFYVINNIIEGEFIHSGTEIDNESYDLYYQVTIDFKEAESGTIEFINTGVVTGIQKDGDNVLLKEITTKITKEESWQYRMEPFIVISAISAIIILFLNAKL